MAACEKFGRLGTGLDLLWDAEDLDTERALSCLPWALVRFRVAEPDVIHATLVEAMPPLGAFLQAPWELSMFWWSSSMLGIESPNLLT